VELTKAVRAYAAMKSQVAHSVAEGGAQSREMPVLLHEWLLAWQDFDQSRWYLMRAGK
jgi:hypothetical protein